MSKQEQQPATDEHDRALFEQTLDSFRGLYARVGNGMAELFAALWGELPAAIPSTKISLKTNTITKEGMLPHVQTEIEILFPNGNLFSIVPVRYTTWSHGDDHVYGFQLSLVVSQSSKDGIILRNTFALQRFNDLIGMNVALSFLTQYGAGAADKVNLILTQAE